MIYHDLRDFIAQLENMGELKRIAVEVDPKLEMTEIADRVLRAGGPALLRVCCRAAVAAGKHLSPLRKTVHQQARCLLNLWCEGVCSVQLGLGRGLEVTENSVE